MTREGFIPGSVRALLGRAAWAVAAGAFTGLMGTDRQASEGAGADGAAAAASAWKEIEHKLQGLFGHETERPKRLTFQFALGVALVAFAIVVAYWFGRRRGRTRAEVLEIHRA